MKKNVSYILSIFVAVLALCSPAICFIVYAVLPTRDFRWLIAAGACLVFAFVSYKPISEWRYRARTDAQTDEFGVSKRKNYDRLSQAERDQIDLQKTTDMERIISTATLRKMTQKGSEDPDADLDKLIGLPKIKQKVREMAAKMEFEQQERKRKGKAEADAQFKSGHHATYFGAPGTGKTSVARIMTGYLYKYGYIKKNKITEVDGNFLKAGTETSTKTTLVARHALDGVLFIDEAYALAYGDGYGLDAVATLIKFMEDYRGRFVLIMAGYTNEMRVLLESNPGFESRIKEYLYFEDYTDDEMEQIFVHMARTLGYEVDSMGLANFRARLASERPLKSFGNARTARSILDESIERHAYNFISRRLDEVSRYKLSAEDISIYPKTI